MWKRSTTSTHATRRGPSTRVVAAHEADQFGLEAIQVVQQFHGGVGIIGQGRGVRRSRAAIRRRRGGWE